MKTIVIGVMPQEHIRARAISIAKGEYKPKAGEPKIWFTSMKSVAEVLSDQNRALLKVIRETNPDSMALFMSAFISSLSSQWSVITSLPILPLTTTRALLISGCFLAISCTCPGWTNSPLILVV